MILKETEKVQKVIMSVKTWDQAQSALKYLALWQSKYLPEQRVTNYILSQCECFCLGYLVGFISANKIPNTKSENSDNDAKDNGQLLSNT